VAGAETHRNCNVIRRRLEISAGRLKFPGGGNDETSVKLRQLLDGSAEIRVAQGAQPDWVPRDWVENHWPRQSDHSVGVAYSEQSPNSTPFGSLAGDLDSQFD
jgi:hypothetical protein